MVMYLLDDTTIGAGRKVNIGCIQPSESCILLLISKHPHLYRYLAVPSPRTFGVVPFQISSLDPASTSDAHVPIVEVERLKQSLLETTRYFRCYPDGGYEVRCKRSLRSRILGMSRSC